MSSLRRHEGYLLVDNRDNPGLPEEVAHAMAPDLPPHFLSGLFEAPTVTCSHCQTVVVLNPDRQRERPFCRKCNHYICDACGIALAQTQECKPWIAVIEEVQEAAVRQQQSGGGIILPADYRPVQEISTNT
jgi:hypothetical protein